MKLSVIVPARNAAAHVDHLLRSLLPQLLPGDECLLVDDASTDDTSQMAGRHGVSVLAVETRGGPAAARNLGVQHATGEVFVFLDSDVVPHPDLLDRIRQHLRESPDLSAVIGSYNADPSEPSTVSRFRNLLHCYTHRRGNPDASTFWAGCGAIRSSVFHSLGGFDSVQFPEPSIEDIELGMRLKRSGGKILLDPTLQVQHRKVWTLGIMLRTDLVYRAIPWTKLILASGAMPRDLNLKASQRISAAAAVAACPLLLLIPWFPMAAGAGVALLLATVVALNAPFYRFLAACGGWWFAVRSIPLHLLYFLCSALGYAIAHGQFYLRRR